VPTPYALSIKRVRARRGFFRVAGTLNVAGAAPTRTRLLLLSAVMRNGKLSTFKAVASTTTFRGKYAFGRRLPKQATLYFVERPPTVAPKCGTSPLGFSCTAAIVSDTLSKAVKVVPAARKRG
jgi:hypothetical protein